MVTEHFNFLKKTILIKKKKKHKHVLVLDWKVIFINCSQFRNLHVNTTAIPKVNKIQYGTCKKVLCLVHSKLPTAMEAMIVVCLLSLLFE